MSYKPDERDLMAYLYGELEGAEKEKVEQYLLQTPEARMELEKLQGVRSMLGMVKDKEVIAPPIFIDSRAHGSFWNYPYIKTIVAVAATILLVLLIGRVTDLQIRYAGNELRIAFGAPQVVPIPTEQKQQLTQQEVQQMINQSVAQSSENMQARWQDTQQKLDASIRKNLASNSAKIDELVQTASRASQEQIRSYVAALQTQNDQMVKDYLQLSSGEQKQYIEDLLVDFAQYLQQQRNDDINVLQTRLSSIEQNTDQFKQETEQILSSIITNTNLDDKKY